MILMNDKYTFLIHPDPLEADRATDDFINRIEEYKFLESELDKLGLISHDVPLSVPYTIAGMVSIAFEKAPSVYSEFMSKYRMKKEK